MRRCPPAIGEEETSEPGSATRTLFPLNASPRLVENIRGWRRSVETFPGVLLRPHRALLVCAGACGGAAAPARYCPPWERGRRVREGELERVRVKEQNSIITWECLCFPV